MLLGCRVVRGPDWRWGDQDGGEGSVGTIVSLDCFSDNRKLPAKTALVCWDIGCIADYRVGLNNCYDLRILDSAQAGVKHSQIICDGCLQNDLAGIRWKCSQCDNFDLCSVCYMNGVHDTNHEFLRYDKPNDRQDVVPVGKRTQATKIQCRGLFPVAQVKRGRDWNDDCELNNMTGVVVGIKAWEGVPRSAVTVRWGDSLEMDHRVGYKGKVDLVATVPSNSALYFYKEHLPLAARLHANYQRVASTGGVQLKEGDKVTIHLDIETLKLMAEGHGGWAPGMEKTIGKVGKVSKIDEDGDVHVNFGLLTNWVFHPEALVKVHLLRPQDKVRVLANKELVIQCQEDHGGWNNAMEKAIGQQGVVMGVDKDGDALVNVGNQHWLFNPAALMLESKENERQPPGNEGAETGGVDQRELIINMLVEGLASQLISAVNGIEQLILAATVGTLEKVKQIIQNEKSLLNQKSDSNKTALHVACHQGHPEIVSYLLEIGADKEIKDEGGHTALHHAAYGDKSGACVVLLLTGNANVNVQDEKTKSTPLHLAVQRDNEKAIEALTKFQHCDANLQDKDGDTPLHLTVMLGQNKNAKTILDNCRDTRLDPSIFNQKGFNLLHLACIKDNQEIAKILIHRYPGMACMGKDDGFFPIHLAALNNRVEIAKMLLQSGHCNVDEVNGEGRTALSIAVGESYDCIIELLIANKANLNKEDNDGDTPLHIAVMKHSISALGVDVSIFSNRTSDPTVTAEYTKAIAVFLVVKGADVNHSNHQGKVPLELCISEDLRKVIEETVRTAPGRAPPIAVRPTQISPRPVPCSPSATSPTSPKATQPKPTPQPRTTVPLQPTPPPVAPKPQRSTDRPNPGTPAASSPCALPRPVNGALGPRPTLPPKPTPPPVPPKSNRHSTNGANQAANRASNLYAVPRPVEGALGHGNEPTSADITVPATLGEGVDQNNEEGAVGGKKSNNQISSDIRISEQQIVTCRLCNDEPATVQFEPCNHKVLCNQCSFRAKVCPQCNTRIENKVVPDGVAYTSMGDIKKDYENRIRDLQKKNDDLERIALCQICMDRPNKVVFIPCRHRTCQECSTKLRKCPTCNKKIADTMPFY